jgi:hypothetical protein
MIMAINELTVEEITEVSGGSAEPSHDYHPWDDIVNWYVWPWDNMVNF